MCRRRARAARGFTTPRRVGRGVAPPLRVVIYRRLMMRIAEAIARRNRAQALVTGEVVG